IAGDEAPEAGMERADVIVLEIDLDEGLPVERILDELDLVEEIALEVELLRDTELREIARHVALAVEEHAVPFLQILARQVETGEVGKLGRAEMPAFGAIAPAMQRARDGAAGKLARALQHDRLPVAADVRDEVVAARSEIARHVALAVEEHAVPFLQILARQVETGEVGKLGRAEMPAFGAIAPAMQRARDGAAGKLARALQHDRLPVAADVRDEVVAA